MSDDPHSVRDGDLIKTTILQRATFRWAPGGRGCALELGDHPVADHLRQLGIGATPIMKRYFVERAGILPVGEVVESGVRPLPGFAGEDRVGVYQVAFTAGALR